VSLVALIGDCSTTTAIAVAASWPVDREVVVLEADRTGGSLAGWLDTPPTPSLTTLVAARGSRAAGRLGDGPRSDDGGESGTAEFGWSHVAHAVQSSASGVHFLAAPVRSREAAIAIAEAERILFPMLDRLTTPTVLADVGGHAAADPLPGVVRDATAVVALHRQDPSSAGAEAVRLDRLVELLEQLAPSRGRLVLGVIGDEPFEVAEIGGYVASRTTTTIAATHRIAFDPLSASVLAGRCGVSAKRLGRLPLARSIKALTTDLLPVHPPATAGPDRRPLADGARR
jgi:hypothetical protein